MNHLLERETGKKLLLLGNEAIIRGGLEAGVRFATAYPGTPSTEIADGFYHISLQEPLYFEYSVNEKVALETAAGAAISGVRTLCCMKHVGLNVAADALMTLAYVGVKGGMVIVTADDPSLHSSQNEQDNRYYARLSGLPMLEPADPQMAKEMTIAGIELSEINQIPVLLRTTTRVNHSRCAVTLGDLPEIKAPEGNFEKDPFNLVVVPMVGRQLHLRLLEKKKKLQEESEKSPFNFTEGTGKWGIVTSGVSYNYVLDAVEDLGIKDKVTIFYIGMSHPFPTQIATDFLNKVESVLVVEELEPYLEETLKVTAFEASIEKEIAGKGDNLIPRHFEIDPGIVKKAISNFFNLESPPAETLSVSEVPSRPPNLCPGCPHRATYYIIKKIVNPETIYPTDIGCYTLGVLPPLSMADFLICMGSSVSSAGGFSKAQKKPIVAFIGDSTFFHSGITGLINAVTNDHNFVLVILDNGTTAMTGHQPHPGVEFGPQGKIEPKVKIEDVVKGCGVKSVAVINPLQIKKSTETIQKLLDSDSRGVKVIIAKSPCPLYERRVMGKKQKIVFEITDECDLCKDCLELACPAIFYEKAREGEERIFINETLCSGCSVCAQVCTAIKAKKKN
ncbi:MAG: indolepyruvate ferredoxin oxidoreductase subunit alpha [Deltaproteobacteria bacterium]|nr:MAG: indolepyruvate ferredoxin oxidoreductase subunit alpha [Deltaproteobacteria bacterium]RLB10104.1 MAG: indolepyruvate ferredoxin oxidoreductase subunit alpha [Deltaproteobacteria bacterium]